MDDLPIIYEDEGIVVVNKPAGLLVHTARLRSLLPSDIEEETVVSWAVHRYPAITLVGDDPVHRPGIVHRLDKDTSGVLVLAKTSDTFSYLKSIFQDRAVTKTYWAIVRGRPRDEEGTIDRPIGIVDGTTKRSVHAKKMVKEALTRYRMIRSWRSGGHDYALLEVYPRTGRTHQIRVHLASIGCPVVGDVLYGGRSGRHEGRLRLHAFALEFMRRPGERLRVEAPPPEGFFGGLSTGP